MSTQTLPPDGLKAIKPYIVLANQLEQKGEVSVAYYCRLYSVQNGMSINKTQPECKKYLIGLMDILEQTKNQNKADEAIHSSMVGQALVERFALSIFSKADDDDRQSRFNKNLVKQFYSAGILFDVLNCFGELSEDLVSKKQYAKRKAMYLNHCFASGETPVPGPLIDDANDNDDVVSQSGHIPAPYQPPFQTSASLPAPSPVKQDPYPSTSATVMSKGDIAMNQYALEQRELAAANANLEPENVNGHHVSAENMATAMKMCKWAINSLQYEDPTTAIKNLEDCLRCLKTGK